MHFFSSNQHILNKRVKSGKNPKEFHRFLREIKVVNSQTMQNHVDLTKFSLKTLIRITKCWCSVLLKVTLDAQTE